MSKIIEILEELNLCGLSCLKDFMEGEIVAIEIKPEVINEKRCSHDEVKLVKTEYKYLSLTREEREKLFNGYFHICFHTDVTETKIQKLNYEDFINQENDFIEVFEEKFSKKSKLLFQEVNYFINNNLDKTDSIKFLLNETLLPKVSSAYIDSLSNCSNFEGKAIYNFGIQGSGNFSENEVEIISLYLGRLKNKLYELWMGLKEKYKYYYDKSDLEISLDKYTLEMNKDSNEKSKSKLSRRDLINNLIGKDTKESILFEKYEKKLVYWKYLNESRDKWLKTPASFIRFYNYCENKEIFKYHLKDSSKGVEWLRNLYEFYEGGSIDSHSKRQKQNTTKTKSDFNFLDII
jgi:hypothetical protein